MRKIWEFVEVGILGPEDEGDVGRGMEGAGAKTVVLSTTQVLIHLEGSI